jgi:hypothetical protein
VKPQAAAQLRRSATMGMHAGRFLFSRLIAHLPYKEFQKCGDWQTLSSGLSRQGVQALDSTTIDLCRALSPWATFQKHKGGIKMHRYWISMAIFPPLFAFPTANCTM